MSDNHITVGKAAYDRLRNPDAKQGIIDTQREMQKGYIDQLVICAKRYPDWKEPFYICVITKKERILENVIRNYFFARQTRPSPDYNMALYQYDPVFEKITFEWCLPDPETVDFILANINTLTNEQDQLKDFCLRFKNHMLV